MAVGTHTLRGSLRRVIGVLRVARAASMPWLLLVARIWLSQTLFVHRIMMMMAASGMHTPPPPLHTALQSVAPLLLATGLLTRPVALALLLETAWGLNDDVSGPQAGLLVGLLVIGPGALSLDHPLGRGLSWFASGPVRALHRLYGSINRWLGPMFWFGLRVGLAAWIAGSQVPALSWLQGGMPSDSILALHLPEQWTVVIAAALVLGCGTRIAALVLVGMIPLAGITMSIDNRLTLLLLLLILAVSGAGAISLDRLLARWAGRDARLDPRQASPLPHVVVVGGGFGGVAAVKGLSGAACRVTLIDQRNHHLFQPLLYQVATAALSPADIATPIRGLFRDQQHVRVHLGEVTGVDPAARDVLLGATRMKFDYLVLATGARHSYFGRDDWAAFAPGLKSIEDATFIRSRLLRAFEEAENATDEVARQAWLTFVIVGGGPTGIELAGAIAELARHGMEREYRTIDPASARVILVQSGPRVLPSFPASLSAAAERSLRGLGVDVRLQARVRGVNELGVTVGDQHIAARTTLWAAGVAASPAAAWLGMDGDASGSAAGRARSVSAGPGADLRDPATPASSMGWDGKPVPRPGAGGKAAGPVCGAADPPSNLHGRTLPSPFPLSPFRQPGDDRAAGGGRRIGSATSVGRAGLVVLGRRPCRISGWRAKPHHRAAGLAVGLLDLRRRSTRLITGDTARKAASAN